MGKAEVVELAVKLEDFGIDPSFIAIGAIGHCAREIGIDANGIITAIYGAPK